MRPSKLSPAVSIETLEFRRLLSATLESQIPAESLNAGSGAAAPITLSNFFNDPTIVSGDSIVQIQTNLPAPDNTFTLMLTDSATPQTVANFLHYISSGEYNNTIIHRSVPGFIIQGGGDYTDGSTVTSFGSIPGESSTATLKNTTGTIAMALTGTAQSPAPNSGSDEWFINLADNPQLDDASDGGPFTAFGQTIYGMDTVNAIAALPVYDGSSISGEWSNLPLQNYDSTTGLQNSNFVILNPAVTTSFLSYSAVSSNPSAVSAAVSGSGLTLTPGSNGGSANITVTATDLGGGTAVSNFTVTVAGSTSPVANADSANTNPGTPVVINVLANDTPAGNLNAASVQIATRPTDGNAVVNSDGTITYTPTTGFTGNDSFSYTVADVDGTRSSPATVSVAVLAPPVAVADSASTAVDTPAIIDVLANDTSGVGLNPASVEVQTSPSEGTAVANSDGTITFTPANGFIGNDSFSYVVADTDGAFSSPATVSITVTPPPGLSATVGTGAAKAITYTDADGTTGTITLRGPGTATVIFQGTGLVQTTGKTGITITGTGQSIAGIDTTGTANASVLTITTKGGTKFINVGELTTQALGSIIAKGVIFTGDITTADGLIGTLSIAGASGGTINTSGIITLIDTGSFSDNMVSSVPGSQSLGNFTAASVPGGTWTLTGTVRSITVTKGDFDAAVTAASIGAIRVKGNLTGALNLTAPGTDLTTLAVTGSIINESITAAGNIGAISATSLTNSQIYAGIGNLSVGQVLPTAATDFVAASSIKSVNLKTVKGSDSFSNSDIAAALLTNLSLGTIQTNNNGNPTGVAAKNITTLTAAANKKFTLKKLTSATDISALLTKAGADIEPDFQIDLISG